MIFNVISITSENSPYNPTPVDKERDVTADKIDIKSTPTVCFETGQVTIQTEIAEQIRTAVFCTKEEAIREALIALGWTPPDDQFISDEQHEEDLYNSTTSYDQEH